MGGFSNSVIGGATKLIRSAIQSPNFLTGVRGWSINKDGSVEFNTGTFRGTLVIQATASGPALLVYTSTPALGNLWMSIGGAGVDQYGNIIKNGLVFYSAGAGQSAPFRIETDNAVPGGNPVEWMSLQANKVVNQLVMTISNFPLWINAGGGVNTGIAICGGLVGKYYFERVRPDGTQVVASSVGAGTPLTNLASEALISDYGSAWNLATGVWTCPVTGIYEIVSNMTWAAWVAGSNGAIFTPLITGARADSIATAESATNDGKYTASTVREILAGETIQINVRQATAANKSLDVTNINGVGSHSRSYISIRRVL